MLTKFTPTITKEVLGKIKGNIPNIITVDSNSELAVQIRELKKFGDNVGGIEIFQRGTSGKATDAYVTKNGSIYEPSLRDENGNFLGKKVGELEPNSQIGKISEYTQRPINLGLYKVKCSFIEKETNYFQQKIIESMNEINQR